MPLMKWQKLKGFGWCFNRMINRATKNRLEGVSSHANNVGGSVYEHIKACPAVTKK